VARPRLGELLVARGVITPAQLAQALQAQQTSEKRLGDILRTMGVSGEQIAVALSEQLEIPLVRLASESLSEAVLQAIPADFARRHQVVPVALTDGEITVALVDPLDVSTIDHVQWLTGRKVRVAITTADDFSLAISRYPGADDVVEGIKDLETIGEEEKDPTIDSLMRMVEEAPIVRLVSHIVTRAVHQRASDIHIEPQEEHLRVRFRVDGLLTTVMTLPRRITPAVISRVKILASMDIAERRIPQDGRMRVHLDGRDVDIRVSTLPNVYGEKAVLRLLDRGSLQLVLDRLGLSAEDAAALTALARRPHGIFLVTGPTGSGKTTTLYSVLHLLNSPEKNVVTIEDPVEYHIAGLTQVQVNPKAGLSFANGLRSFLRQDPNVIMVGEIRDTETANLAVQAALTGHLVLSTLHTNDAPGAVTRLLDMGIEPYRVAATLLGSAAQRLVRVLCPTCKEPATLARDVATALLLPVNGEPLTVYRARGCPACGHTGYRGRVAIFELMQVTKDIQALVTKGAPEHAIRATAIRGGMRTLLQDGAQKVLAGVTSVEELLRVVDGSEQDEEASEPEAPRPAEADLPRPA
jgi:type IV pilus assembly protein PilB